MRPSGNQSPPSVAVGLAGLLSLILLRSDAGVMEIRLPEQTVKADPGGSLVRLADVTRGTFPGPFERFARILAVPDCFHQFSGWEGFVPEPFAASNPVELPLGREIPDPFRYDVIAHFVVIPRDKKPTVFVKRREDTFGGAGTDAARVLLPLPDGGALIGLTSDSEPGPGKTATRIGGSDFWVVRVDTSGGRVWEASFGTIGDDVLRGACRTSDGGFVLVGDTRVDAGGAVGSHGIDGLVVRIDGTGAVRWQRTLSGAAYDSIAFATELADGTVVVAGTSDSPVADGYDKLTVAVAASPPFVDPPVNSRDVWVIWLGAQGEFQKDRVYGSDNDEELVSGTVLKSGDLALAATRSNDPTQYYPTDPFLRPRFSFGGSDAAVTVLSPQGDVRTDVLNRLSGSGGRISGNFAYLGSYSEDRVGAILPWEDGGFILGCSSVSEPSCVWPPVGGRIICDRFGGDPVPTFKGAPNLGGFDYWLIRIGAAGDVLWEKTYGNAQDDFVTALVPGIGADAGTFFAIGSSVNGLGLAECHPSFGGADFHLIHIDGGGNQLGECLAGGPGGEAPVAAAMVGKGLWVLGTADPGPTEPPTPIRATAGMRALPGAGGTDGWLVDFRSGPVAFGSPVILVNGEVPHSDRMAFDEGQTVEVELALVEPGPDSLDPLTSPIKVQVNDDEPYTYLNKFQVAGPTALVASRGYPTVPGNLQASVQLDFFPRYSLTVNVPGGGVVSVDPPSSESLYRSNSAVMLTATALPGWHLMGWKVGDASVSASPLSLQILSNTAVEAVFGTPLNLLVDPSSPAGGTTVPEAQAGLSLPFGADARLEAMPATGYYFLEWAWRAGSNPYTRTNQNPVRFPVDRTNFEAVAYFQPLNPGRFALTVLNAGDWSVSYRSNNVPVARRSFFPNNTQVELRALAPVEPTNTVVGFVVDGVTNPPPLQFTITSNTLVRVAYGLLTTPPTAQLASPAAQSLIPVGDDVRLSATVEAGSGLVASVVFRADGVPVGTNSPAGLTQGPIDGIWIPSVVGEHVLDAVVFNSIGLSRTSAPVVVSVGPAIRFATDVLRVNESDGEVIASIVSQGGNAAVVEAFTRDGTAESGHDFRSVPSSSVVLGNGLGTVKVPLFDNFLDDGERRFEIVLANPPQGFLLGSPSVMTVVIRDDDPPAGSSFRSRQAPALAKGEFTIRITNSPPEPGQWRLPWEREWHSPGEVVSNLLAGVYPIVFKPLAGPGLPALTEVNVTGAERVEFSTQYTPRSAPPATGRLSVLLGSANPNWVLTNASWRLDGEGEAVTGNGFRQELPAGEHLLTFDAPIGWTAPEARAVTVVAGVTVDVLALFERADCPAGENAKTPVPVTGPEYHRDFGGDLGPTYRVNGQIRSPGAGSGSGVAVRERVVLTAAHVVFNPQDLAFVGDATWQPGRFAPGIEPRPQRVRGILANSGYADRRRAELSGPSDSPSEVLDAAALWFGEPAAAGGFAGFLVSSNSATEQLNSSIDSALVGYPTVGGPACPIIPGRPYRIETGRYSYTLRQGGSGELPGLLETTGYASFPGNSGGPVYARFGASGPMFPAGIYLGSTADGGSRVRVIDATVAALINRAASYAAGGTNFNSGGVIQFSTEKSSALQKLTVRWTGTTNGGWVPANNPAVVRTNGESVRIVPGLQLALRFRDVSGYLTPDDIVFTVPQSVDVAVDAAYVPLPPPKLRVDLSPGFQLWVRAASGQRLVLQFRSNLDPGTAWKSVSTNTATGDEFTLPIEPASGSSGYYRVVIPSP